MKNIVITTLIMVTLFTSVNILSSSTVITINSLKEHREAFYYLNFLRTSAGLNFLFQNDYLDKASFNHSQYLVKNGVFGHFQDRSLPFFTGRRPLDRVYHVGYKSTQIIENISSNAKNYKESIDGLFSGIYHRFAFLDFSVSEIGIGVVFDKLNVNNNAFVYDMGNSQLNKLCFEQKNSCVLDKKIELPYQKFISAINWKKISNPKVVVYPYANQKDVPTSFYQEDPNPVPFYDVHGFPISIQFNDYYANNIEIQSFELFDAENRRINSIFIDAMTDINQLFKNGEFAIYPIEKLNNDSCYHVKVSYILNNRFFFKEWFFFTQKRKYDEKIITFFNFIKKSYDTLRS